MVASKSRSGPIGSAPLKQSCGPRFRPQGERVVSRVMCTSGIPDGRRRADHLLGMARSGPSPHHLAVSTDSVPSAAPSGSIVGPFDSYYTEHSLAETRRHTWARAGDGQRRVYLAIPRERHGKPKPRRAKEWTRKRSERLTSGERQPGNIENGDLRF
jgi:hypothetical protein